MVLDLPVENKSSEAFLVDQTPTPTRLIENCEEVGLFEDLEHVNPFDETFRRAVESNAVGAVAVPPTKTPENQECDESLHTPQVFISNENAGETFNNFGAEKCSLILSENLTAKQKAKSETQESADVSKESHTEEIENEDQENSGGSVNATTENRENQKISDAQLLTVGVQSIVSAQILNPQSVIILPVKCQKPLIQSDSSKIETEKRTNTGKSKKEPLILPKDSDFSPELITVRIPPKTPAAAVKSKPFILPRCDVKEGKPVNEDKDEGTKSLNGMKRSATKNSRKEEVPAKRIIKDDEYMERHRAAVSRYRIRQKKEWAELWKTNAILAEENKRLQQENTKLKQLLALHQNCQLVQLIPLGTCPQNINSQLILNAGNAPVMNSVSDLSNNDNAPKTDQQMEKQL